MKLAGLQAQLDADAPKGTPRADNWATVQEWTEESRYELGTSQAEAEGLYDAITNATEGVLPWVKAHW